MTETMTLTAPVDAEAVSRLSKDLKASARLLGQSEARYLVDQYYQIQDYRIRAAGQVRSQEGEPNAVLEWALGNMATLEAQIQRALNEFTKEYAVGQWLQSLTGIGPVIAAGLMAHLDVRRCEHAGGFWKFAGIDANAKWNKGEKRPWNADLKVLLWKAGESFVKVQNNKNDVYGKLFAAKKAMEWENNLRGRLKDECERILSTKNYNHATLAYRFYSGQMSPSIVRDLLNRKEPVPPDMKATKNGDERPMLPPAHIHARARRYAEKIFLSHVHHVMYDDFHGMEPKPPYILAKTPEPLIIHSEPVTVDDMKRWRAESDAAGYHRHLISVPNWPNREQFKGRSLKELLVSELKAA